MTAAIGINPPLSQGHVQLHSRATVRATRTNTDFELDDGACEFDARIPQIRTSEPEASFTDTSLRGTLAQRRTWRVPTGFPDLQTYALTRITGVVSIAASKASVGDIDLDDLQLRVESASNRLYAAAHDVALFGGRFDAGGSVVRRKVKGEPIWRYLYEVDVGVRDLNAAVMCDVLKLERNRITGRFSGELSTTGVDLATRSLRGQLHSDEPGLLFANDAEKVVVDFSADEINRQIVNQMIARLKRFRYDSCRIDLNYAPVENVTTVTLTVSNDLDRISFPLHYSGTWVDAIMRNLQYR
jgi:hypothetical protein